MLLAFYIYISKKITHKTLILIGTLLGIAFLTRFPQGLGLVAIGSVVLLDNIKNGIIILIKKLTSLIFGFFLVVAPYLAYNQYAYKEMFYPFVAGAKIITQKLWFHQTGVLFE